MTTFGNKEDAVRLGKALLQERLIACYNLLPVESAYWWKGKIEEAQEVLMFMKTQDQHVERITDVVKSNSSYEIPEIVAFSPEKVNESYLQWILKETKPISVTSDSQ